MTYQEAARAANEANHKAMRLSPRDSHERSIWLELSQKSDQIVDSLSKDGGN